MTKIKNKDINCNNEDIHTDENNIEYNEFDRITVFKRLAVNQIDNTVNMAIFENLLNDYYSDFINFCDQVKNSSEKIESVTCYIKNGKLEFDLQLDEK